MYKEISGFQVEIVRKKIKNIYLYILPDGKIRVSAPTRAPDFLVEEFVTSKANWIEKQQKKISEHIVKPTHEYIDGETLYLFGEKHILCVKEGKRNCVLCEDKKIILTIKPNIDLQHREAVINEFYREELKEKITEYFPKWEKITGLYGSWQIKNMKTRWGTCNIAAKKIWLNLQLAKMPIECLEYVILHELAHLAVSNHGPQFCAILDKFMPNWRSIKKRLNEEYGNMQ